LPWFDQECAQIVD